MVSSRFWWAPVSHFSNRHPRKLLKGRATMYSVAGRGHVKHVTELVISDLDPAALQRALT